MNESLFAIIDGDQLPRIREDARLHDYVSVHECKNPARLLRMGVYVFCKESRDLIARGKVTGFERTHNGIIKYDYKITKVIYEDKKA
jgi:hypothetical protein